MYDTNKGLNLPYHDVCLDGLDVPQVAPDVDDGQLITVRYNRHYYKYLVGVLGRMLWSDAWLGSDAQKREAVGNAAYLIQLLGTPIDCVETNPMFAFRFTDTCGLEYTLDGEEWIPVDGWDTFSPVCFTGPEGPPGGGNVPGSGGDTGGGAGPGNDVPVLDYDGCDEDVLFGWCLQIVDLLHQLIFDFFQVLEVATNPIERIESFVDEVPFLGQYFDLLDKLFDEVREAYQAAFDEPVRLTYACLLFCAAREKGCYLEWEDLARIFSDRAGYNLGQEIVNVVVYIVSGVWTGTLAADIMFALFTTCIYHGATWLGINLVVIQRLAASYLNDPNPDWEILCDDCPELEFCYQFLFSAEEEEWQSIQGTYVPGSGFVGVPLASSGRDFGQRYIRNVTTSYSASNVQSGARCGIVLYRNGGQVWSLDVETRQGTDEAIFGVPNGVLADRVVTYVNTGSGGGTATIKGVRVEGDGSNPFGETNC